MENLPMFFMSKKVVLRHLQRCLLIPSFITIAGLLQNHKIKVIKWTKNKSRSFRISVHDSDFESLLVSSFYLKNHHFKIPWVHCKDPFYLKISPHPKKKHPGKRRWSINLKKPTPPLVRQLQPPRWNPALKKRRSWTNMLRISWDPPMEGSKNL